MYAQWAITLTTYKLYRNKHAPAVALAYQEPGVWLLLIFF